MPPPKAPTRAARPTDLWIVDSNSDLRQLEGLADFANLADFASEDTLPPPQPADFVNLADFASEDTLPPPQPADFVNLADFASEDTLPPPQPPNREGCSALDTFPDEVTLDSPTPTPVFSSPAAARAIRGRATRDRRRYVFFALTSVALLAGVVALETPRLLVEWAWQPLGRTASAPTVSSRSGKYPGHAGVISGATNSALDSPRPQRRAVTAGRYFRPRTPSIQKNRPGRSSWKHRETSPVSSERHAGSTGRDEACA